MPLTKDQIDEFKSKGFIVVKGLYDKAAMAKVSVHLDDLLKNEPAENTEAKYFEESPVTGENMLVRIEHFMGEHNAELSELVHAPQVIECLAELFGEPPVLFKDKINYKLPGCRADKLHQDQAAGWGRYCDFFITMLVAVDENRRENAAVSVMSSGNFERRLMTEEWQPLSDEDPPNFPEDEYMLLEVDPGDVVFFDPFVPHGSPANTSDKSRRNLFLTYNKLSDGDMRAKYYEDKWANYAPNKIDEVRTGDTFRV